MLKGTFNLDTLKTDNKNVVLDGTFNLQTLDAGWGSLTIPAGTTVRTRNLRGYNIKVLGTLIVTGNVDGSLEGITYSGSGKLQLPAPVLKVKTEKETETLYGKQDKWWNSLDEYIYLETKNYGGRIRAKSSSFKLVSVKSSNKKVLTAARAKSGSDGTLACKVKLKKTGKATVTLKLKHLSSGKTITYKKVYTVKKYANPIKTLKIGKKSLASKFKSATYYGQGKKLSGKLQIKTKNGWKVERIDLLGKSQVLKNDLKSGTKITLKKGYTLEVTLTKKGWRQMNYSIYIY